MKDPLPTSVFEDLSTDPFQLAGHASLETRSIGKLGHSCHR
jgi:hypothetical protein